MCREHAAGEQLGELADDVSEYRRIEDVGCPNAVDLLRPEIAFGVDQRLPATRHRAVIVDVRHPDLDNAVVVRGEQAGRLEIDHCERHQAPASDAAASASRTRSLPDMS